MSWSSMSYLIRKKRIDDSRRSRARLSGASPRKPKGKALRKLEPHEVIAMLKARKATP